MNSLRYICALLSLAGTLLGIPPAHAQESATSGGAVPANIAPHPAPEQPLPYSHKTHLRLGLICQLCHTNPATGAHMSFPATATCMKCHAALLTDHAPIQKLTAYAKSKQPIPWVRVYQVLPGVSWTHRAHLQAGVSCQTCHGAVSELDAMSEQTAVTSMASCVRCHEARHVSAACTVCHAWPAKASIAVPSAAPTATPTLTPASLRVISFPGGANLPLWVAADKGFFEREQLAVNVSPTPNSVVLVQSLINDEQDIALAAFDNVVAYQEDQGDLKLSNKPDFFAFMGISHGTVRLDVNPEISSYADLRGKTLAVDALTTGYSLVLEKLLQLGGLQPNEYRLDPVGATATRAQGLVENKFAGTILTTPLEIGPESHGYRRLANAVDVIGPYQTIVGVARRSWAESHRDALVRFIRASNAAMDWLFDPANRAEAVSIYRQHLPTVPEPAAALHIAALLGEREGFTRGTLLDAQGIQTVLKIRSELGVPRKTLTDPSRYIDESYHEAALHH
jgi:ABC-type nitrate/sulfonate/bicarbonate transport system substrate-binding protein